MTRSRRDPDRYQVLAQWIDVFFPWTLLKKGNCYLTSSLGAHYRDFGRAYAGPPPHADGKRADPPANGDNPRIAGDLRSPPISGPAQAFELKQCLVAYPQVEVSLGHIR